VTFETDELGGSQPGRKFSTTPDQPARDGDAEGRRPRGQLEARHQDGGVRAARPCGRAGSATRHRTTCSSHEPRAPHPSPSSWRLRSSRRRSRLAKDQTQQFFEQRLLADKQTSKAIKTLLRAAGGFVDRGVAFQDVTGDKRDDASCASTAAAPTGAVAVYVFSTANKKGGKLKAIFRSRSSMRASTRVRKGVADLPTARYEPGDELCCPSHVTESTLRWDRPRAA
jgi:hypothetical protein